MALDPSISLGIKPPPQMDIGKWANLAKSGLEQQALQQQIQTAPIQRANLAAQTAGLQAQSQQEQFAAQRQKDIKDITAASTTHNDKDGTVTFDALGAMDKIAEAGYLPEAQSLYANHFSNMAAKANAEQSVANKEQSRQNVRDRLFDKTISMAQTMNQQNPGTGDNFLIQSFTNLHRVPDIEAALEGDPRFDVTKSLPAGLVKAGAKSNLAPQDQILVDMNDKDSIVSKNVREALDRAKIPYTGTPTAAEASKIPGAGAIVENSIVPVSAKLAAVGDTNALAALQVSANAGIAAANSLIQDTKYKLAPTDMLGNLLSKFGTDPRMQQLNDSLSKYENDTHTKVDRDHISIKGTMSMLNNWNSGSGPDGSGGLGQRMVTARTVQQSPTVSGITTPQPQAGTITPTPGVPPAQGGRGGSKPTVSNW